MNVPSFQQWCEREAAHYAQQAREAYAQGREEDARQMLLRAMAWHTSATRQRMRETQREV